MPTTATADNFDKTKTMWNPGKVYIGMAVPAVGAAPVLHTDGSPDATTNPLAVHIGYTDKGTKCHYKWTKADATDDEHTAPHDTRIVAEEMMIEGAWKQILDETLLAPLSVGGTAASVTGGKIVEFGGLQTITTQCIAVIAPRKNNPAKFIVFMIYDGFNTEGFEINNTKDGESSSPFKFTGNAIATRAAGKQLGQIFIGA